MARKVKAKDYEKLDNASVSRVIKLLSSDKPITKKEACQLLNISYNTTRLNRIIEEYKDRQEFVKKRRQQNRGKPISDFEVKEIVLNYLLGVSKQQIADMLYRSPSSINRILEKHAIPERGTGDYRTPALIPDEGLSEEYSPGELVWSARYNTVAEVIKFFNKDPEHGNVYALWVFGKFNQRAFQPWYELGKLEIVNKLGIKASDIQTTDKINMEYTIG